jgi:hypothetical protein
VAGHGAMRAFWQWFFDRTPNATIEIEELFSCEDRVTMRWLYRWGNEDVEPRHVRGVDVYRVRLGKIAERLSYVNG